MWEFNPETSLWTQITQSGTVPAARAFGTMEAIGDKLFMFGGGIYLFDAGFTHTFFGDTWVFDTRTSSWTQLFPATAPTPREGAFGGQVGDQLMVYGGLNQAFIFETDTWRYHPRSNTWVQATPSTNPGDRRVGGYASIGSSIYVFGGEIFNAEFIFSTLGDMWVFSDTRNGRWVQKASLPAASRNGVSMAFYDDRTLIMYGGDRDVTDPSIPESAFPRKNISDETWSFNADRNEWAQVSVPTPPPAIEFTVMRKIDHSIFMFGGYGWNNVNRNQPYNRDVYRFDLHDDDHGDDHNDD